MFIFTSLIGLSTNGFTALMVGSESEIQIERISQNNSAAYLETLTKPEYTQKPYNPLVMKNAKTQVELHLKDQDTIPGALIIRLAATNQLIGSSWACAGRIYHDKSKSFAENLDTVGYNAEGRTEMGWGKVRLLEQYKHLKPMIMDILIGKAFDQVPTLQTIAFGVRGIKNDFSFDGEIVKDDYGYDVNLVKEGMQYARDRKLVESQNPIDAATGQRWNKMPYSHSNDENYVYCFDITREFFEKNRNLFTYYIPSK